MRLIPSSWLIGLVLCVLTTSTSAINNIESQRFKAIPQGVSGETQGAFSGRSGNGDRQSTLLRVRTDYLDGIHQWLLIGKREFGQSNGNTDIDNSFLHLRYIHHLDKRYAWETFTQYEEDFFRQLEARALAGGGMRFNLFPKPEEMALIIGTGAYYTKERYDYGPYSSDSDHARFSSYVSFRRIISDTTSIANTLYYQPRMSKPSDYYAYNLFTLAVKISKTLQLQVNVESNFDSEPILELEQYDHNYYTSIVYLF
jgi:hypothetical protein